MEIILTNKKKDFVPSQDMALNDLAKLARAEGIVIETITIDGIEPFDLVLNVTLYSLRPGVKPHKEKYELKKYKKFTVQTGESKFRIDTIEIPKFEIKFIEHHLDIGGIDVHTLKTSEFIVTINSSLV
jgi:hypothetical protein